MRTSALLPQVLEKTRQKAEQEVEADAPWPSLGGLFDEHHAVTAYLRSRCGGAIATMHWLGQHQVSVAPGLLARPSLDDNLSS